MLRYTKSRVGAPEGFFEAEAIGLDWLKVNGGPDVVKVFSFGKSSLEIERVIESNPTAESAYDFGAKLAVLHKAPVDNYGYSPSPNWYFGTLSDPIELPNANTAAKQTVDYKTYLKDYRLLPVLEEGVRRMEFTKTDIELTLDALNRIDYSDPVLNIPPSRVHGDLWSGNLLWTKSSATLIDTSAHGGHPEEDLALLKLFGCPHYTQILAGYQSITPLAHGFDHRVNLHNLFPIAYHAIAFGGGYRRKYLSMLEGI
ncbi:fructosamine kinase [Actinomycetota bacterium]|nr:fructosamine kinase [Actinomycetota bacterium]